MDYLQAQLPMSAYPLLTGSVPNHDAIPTPVTACFVDLAHFTAISEQLGRQGSTGTELLVDLINRVFTSIIDGAAGRGGDVVGFGGDSLTVLFPDDGMEAATAWARQSIDSIGRLPEIETTTGAFKMEAKIGIGDGTQQLYLVGTETTQRLVASGSAIERAVWAESQVSPGEIGIAAKPGVLPPKTVKRGELHLLGGPVDSPPSVPVSLPVPTPMPTAAPPPVDPERITPFIPPRVLARLQTSLGLLDEHRPVSIVFTGLGDRPLCDDPTAPGRLSEAIAIIEERGGTAISVGSGDKGTTLLAAFGAPVALPDQRSIAVFAAAELVDRIPCRVGISSGFCFAGRVGSSRRWSYNLMGSVVNKAARLMTVAPPGGVLADDATSLGSDVRIIWNRPQELALKGLDEAVAASVLHSISDDESGGTDLPLIGRQVEVAALAELIATVTADGTGRGLVIIGESGTGKTRLTREASDVARNSGVLVTALGLAHRRSERSYAPWRSVMFDRLGLAEDCGPAEFESAVRDQLGNEGSAPDLLREVVFGDPSLHPVLTGLDTRSASEIVEAAIAKLVLDPCDRPLLLIADDAHDLDEASGRLLERVSRNLSTAPIALVAVTYADQDIAAWNWLRPLPIGELAEPEALELIRNHERKADFDLTATRRRAIYDLVGGNAQLLRLLADYVGTGHDDLPVDAAALVLGRFDRLTSRSQASLNMAATLGRHFKRSDFLGAFTERVGADSLRELVSQRLIEPIGQEILSFASPALWQVAYESSAHASRAAFHGQVGRYLEQLPDGPSDQRVEDLAHHFGFTADTERHRRYFEPAARRAKKAFANSKAITWFERAIEVSEPDRTARLRCELGSVIEHVGRRAEAAEQFQAASADASVAPRALASLALLQVDTVSYDLALSTINRALEAVEKLDDDTETEWVLERASLLHATSGRFELSRAMATRQLEVATRIDAPDRIAAALSNLGAAKSWIGELEGAEDDLNRSLELSLASGAMAVAADVEIDLAMVALDLGRLDACLARLESARDRSMATGYRRGEATALSNSALALVTAERYEEAWGPTKASLRLMLEMGDVITATASAGVLSLLLLHDDRPHAAISFLGRVLRAGRAAGTPIYRERAYGVLIDAYRTLDDADLEARCEDQLQRLEHEVSDDEISQVAPCGIPPELEDDVELSSMLLAADDLIERLQPGGH